MLPRSLLPLALWLAVALAASAAPAPLTRRGMPAKPLYLAGEWSLRWSGCDYRATLTDDRRYVARCESGTVWHGTWTLEGRTISVDEISQGGERATWSVVLDDSLTGKTQSGTLVEWRR